MRQHDTEGHVNKYAIKKFAVKLVEGIGVKYIYEHTQAPAKKLKKPISWNPFKHAHMQSYY